MSKKRNFLKVPWYTIRELFMLRLGRKILKLIQKSSIFPFKLYCIKFDKTLFVQRVVETYQYVQYEENNEKKYKKEWRHGTLWSNPHDLEDDKKRSKAEKWYITLVDEKNFECQELRLNENLISYKQSKLLPC